MVASRANLTPRSLELGPLVALDFVEIHLIEQTSSDTSKHDNALTLNESQRMAFPRNRVNSPFNGFLFLPGNYLRHLRIKF